VWGKAPTSIGCYEYYVSFIDDYSKFSWIYLLKKKSKVFEVFQNFQNLVERKFDRKIIAMQTNWGGEYEKLSPLLKKMGISHHVSCPHAHQQYGSAECKHRHIVEVGLALLANASMLLNFWDEAFLIATHLINMLPPLSLTMRLQWSVFFMKHQTTPLFGFFGCAYWPNLCPYNSLKLAFRSKQCVFIGYSNMHKGVKCIDVATG
jgi:histone deacetylase 1/2